MIDEMHYYKLEDIAKQVLEVRRSVKRKYLFRCEPDGISKL